jgi:hypothetical protein
MVICWFLFFSAIYLLSNILSPIMFPHILKKTDKKSHSRVIKWNLEVVSLVNSIIICSLAIPYYIIMKVNPSNLEFSEIVNDPFYGYSERALFVISIATGYFVWDLIVSIIHYPILKFVSLFHAMFSMLSFLMIFKTRLFIYYGLVFLIFEASTPFLNIRSLLNKANKSKSKLYYINGILFVFTFFLSRLVFGFYQFFNCSSKIIHNWEQFSPIVVTWYFIASTSSNVINIYWFVKIIMRLIELFEPEHLQRYNRNCNQ